jgi:hypothetical protein
MLQIPEPIKMKDKSPSQSSHSSAISATPASRKAPSAITPLMDQISGGLILATPAPLRAAAALEVPANAHTPAEIALRDLRPHHHTPLGSRSGSGAAGGGGGGVGGSAAENFESSYFIGLTFCNGLRSVDLTTAIQVIDLFDLISVQFTI